MARSGSSSVSKKPRFLHTDIDNEVADVIAASEKMYVNFKRAVATNEKKMHAHLYKLKQATAPVSWGDRAQLKEYLSTTAAGRRMNQHLQSHDSFMETHHRSSGVNIDIGHTGYAGAGASSGAIDQVINEPHFHTTLEVDHSPYHTSTLWVENPYTPTVTVPTNSDGSLMARRPIDDDALLSPAAATPTKKPLTTATSASPPRPAGAGTGIPLSPSAVDAALTVKSSTQANRLQHTDELDEELAHSLRVLSVESERVAADERARFRKALPLSVTDLYGRVKTVPLAHFDSKPIVLKSMKNDVMDYLESFTRPFYSSSSQHFSPVVIRTSPVKAATLAPPLAPAMPGAGGALNTAERIVSTTIPLLDDDDDAAALLMPASGEVDGDDEESKSADGAGGTKSKQPAAARLRLPAPQYPTASNGEVPPSPLHISLNQVAGTVQPRIAIINTASSPTTGGLGLSGGMSGGGEAITIMAVSTSTALPNWNSTSTSSFVPSEFTVTASSLPSTTARSDFDGSSSNGGLTRPASSGIDSGRQTRFGANPHTSSLPPLPPNVVTGSGRRVSFMPSGGAGNPIRSQQSSESGSRPATAAIQTVPASDIDESIPPAPPSESDGATATTPGGGDAPTTPGGGDVTTLGGGDVPKPAPGASPPMPRMFDFSALPQSGEAEEQKMALAIDVNGPSSARGPMAIDPRLQHSASTNSVITIPARPNAGALPANHSHQPARDALVARASLSFRGLKPPPPPTDDDSELESAAPTPPLGAKAPAAAAAAAASAANGSTAAAAAPALPGMSGLSTPGTGSGSAPRDSGRFVKFPSAHAFDVHRLVAQEETAPQKEDRLVKSREKKVLARTSSHNHLAEYRNKLTEKEKLRHIAVVSKRGAVAETAAYVAKMEKAAKKRRDIARARAHAQMRTTSGNIQLQPVPPSPTSAAQAVRAAELARAAALRGEPAPGGLVTPGTPLSLASLFRVNRGFLKKAAVAVGAYDTEYLRVPGVSTSVASWTPPPKGSPMSAAAHAAAALAEAANAHVMSREAASAHESSFTAPIRPFTLASLVPHDKRSKQSLNLKEIIGTIRSRTDD